MGSGVVTLAAGPYRVVVDALASTPTPSSVTDSGGATPIFQVLTTDGRWEIVSDSLYFVVGDSRQPTIVSDGVRQVGGMAFTAGRVVAATIVGGGPEPLVEVSVFEADTALLIATGAPVGLDQAAADGGGTEVSGDSGASGQSGEGTSA